MLKEIQGTPSIQLQPFPCGLADEPVGKRAFFISCNMETKEIWKDIPGYEGLYQASNLGRIKRFTIRTGRKRENMPVSFSESINKPIKYTNGYLAFTICKNGIKKTGLLHRLVAKLFIPNPNNLPEINHKDENKENNRADNLEWCTHKYNMNYGTARERTTKTVIKNKTYAGEKNGRAKLTNDQVIEIFTSPMKCHPLAELYSMEVTAIYDIKNRKKWRHITCNL